MIRTVFRNYLGLNNTLLTYSAFEVRSEAALDSPEVGILWRGDVVQQTGHEDIQVEALAICIQRVAGNILD